MIRLFVNLKRENLYMRVIQLKATDRSIESIRRASNCDDRNNEAHIRTKIGTGHSVFVSNILAQAKHHQLERIYKKKLNGIETTKMQEFFSQNFLFLSSRCFACILGKKSIYSRLRANFLSEVNLFKVIMCQIPHSTYSRGGKSKNFTKIFFFASVHTLPVRS